jgi:hypothetical protein
MGFVENLRKKIEIDETVNRILAAWGPPGSGRRIDKEIVRGLLEMGPFRHEQTRDLDLYHLEMPGPEGKGRILVLDNELPIFETTVEDVAMRRSPLIKEMVNIRKAIRILNDKDITVSKRQESLERVRNRLIEGLDLSFSPSDIAHMADDGVSSLEKDYIEGVSDSLRLFAELLDYRPAPKAFQRTHVDIYGAVDEGPAGELRFGPMVIYNRAHSELRLLEQQISSRNAAGVEWVGQVAKGKEPADREGEAVFGWLKEQVLKRHPGGRLDSA